jgi:hypothetical protein
MNCRACKTELVANAAFCHGCGARTGLAEPVRKKPPARKKKSDMTESEWVLQDVPLRYLWPSDMLTRHPTCREVWDALTNPIWQVAILDTLGYANEPALRRFLLDAVAEAKPEMTDIRSLEALDTVEAYLAGRADAFDLRDAWRRADTAAHDAAFRRLDARAVAAAEAAALAASPVWMLKEDSLYRAGIVREGLVRLGRLFAAHQVGQAPFGPRPDEFKYRADDPYMVRLAEDLRVRLGNPFVAEPSLAMRSHEQTRALGTWESRTGGRARVSTIDMHDWRVRIQLPGGTELTERYAYWRQATHAAYRLALAAMPIPAKRPARPSR